MSDKAPGFDDPFLVTGACTHRHVTGEKCCFHFLPTDADVPKPNHRDRAKLMGIPFAQRLPDYRSVNAGRTHLKPPLPSDRATLSHHHAHFNPSLRFIRCLPLSHPTHPVREGPPPSPGERSEAGGRRDLSRAVMNYAAISLESWRRVEDWTAWTARSHLTRCVVSYVVLGVSG